MIDFFQMRLRRHHKRMLKYLRYVFNDHFILICLFLFGGLGLYYSQFMKSLPLGFSYGLLVTGLIWLVLLHFGKLATLIQPADVVFILPKEKQMSGYLNKALLYSLWLPYLILAFTAGVVMPLIVIAGNVTFSAFIWFLLLLWSLKYSHLQLQKRGLYQKIPGQKGYYLIWLFSSGILIGLALVYQPIIALVLGIFQAVFFTLIGKKAEKLPLDWLKMVALEEQRLHQIYQFINLFTDVPEITATVKRRKLFDPWLNKIKKTSQNTYLYLFSRRFVRGSEYSGLYLRLVLIGGLILYFVADLRFAIVIGLLFIYLIGFQLLPLYNQFTYMILTELYPVPKKQKKAALQKLLLFLLSLVSLIFAVIVALQQKNVLSGLLTLGILIASVVLFCQFYLPGRIKKMEE